MRMSRWPSAQWISLMLESQQVMGLRMMKLAMGGPEAQAEAWHMVEEKLSATAEAARLVTMGMMRGDGPGGSADAVRMLHRKVRSNRKRLTEGK